MEIEEHVKPGLRRLILGVILVILLTLFPQIVLLPHIAQAESGGMGDEPIPDPPYSTFMPLVVTIGQAVAKQGCPVVSDAVYGAVPVLGPPTDRVPRHHADLNLSLRSYSPVNYPLRLIQINGPTDPNAPQLSGLFATPRAPTFTNVYRVNDWVWLCSDAPRGCQGGPLPEPAVTLAGLASVREDALYAPTRPPQIYAGGYVAMVLYAEETRLTFVYTREDTVAVGYAVHLEDICVDPNLLALYQELDGAGRGALPALRNGEALGTAASASVKVVVRDSGSFMDPRSRKDWWRGY